MAKEIPGINIQWPWSELLLNGKKTIETRTYPLPKKFEGVELAIIETPGPRGKKEAGIDKARIIGTIVFGQSFQYKNEKEWRNDQARHRVDVNDPQFAWDKRDEVWGWEVKKVKWLPAVVNPPKKRGIVFANSCII